MKHYTLGSNAWHRIASIVRTASAQPARGLVVVTDCGLRYVSLYNQDQPSSATEADGTLCTVKVCRRCQHK
jgi:hypothetical protein